MLTKITKTKKRTHAPRPTRVPASKITVPRAVFAKTLTQSPTPWLNPESRTLNPHPRTLNAPARRAETHTPKPSNRPTVQPLDFSEPAAPAPNPLLKKPMLGCRLGGSIIPVATASPTIDAIGCGDLAFGAEGG
jgi:hypothetical protein